MKEKYTIITKGYNNDDLKQLSYFSTEDFFSFEKAFNYYQHITSEEMINKMETLITIFEFIDGKKNIIETKTIKY